MSFCSSSKQRGASTSSKFTAPKLEEVAHHRLNDLIDVSCVGDQRNGVQSGELSEEGGLSLHHRQGGRGADVAQSQDRRAVGQATTSRSAQVCVAAVEGSSAIARDTCATPGV